MFKVCFAAAAVLFLGVTSASASTVRSFAGHAYAGLDLVSATYADGADASANLQIVHSFDDYRIEDLDGEVSDGPTPEVICCTLTPHSNSIVLARNFLVGDGGGRIHYSDDIKFDVSFSNVCSTVICSPINLLFSFETFSSGYGYSHLDLGGTRHSNTSDTLLVQLGSSGIFDASGFTYIDINETVAAMPLPAGAALLPLALGFMVVLKRRRRTFAG